MDYDSLPWYKKLEKLRKENNWTQQQVATKCKTSQKGYWVWEKGKRYPVERNRKALAEIFGVELDELF